MNTLQEALRELMRRTKDAKKDDNKYAKKVTKAASKQSLTEAVKTPRKKEKLLIDLWDQVYCTLVDAGDNKIYEICGGKGKYSPGEAAVKLADSKYGDNILSIIYDKNNESKTEEQFFAEAAKQVNKFGLETSRKETRNYVLFNVHIPQEEPVYFDLIPARFRKKIAIENEENLEDLPTSSNYSGDALLAESFEEESITEDLNIALPVNILSENEILEFVESVPKATKERGPASLTFTIGFVTDLDRDIASQFKENGRGHINKETGETFPVVNIVKCSEISGLYLESYGTSKKTIAHKKQMAKYATEYPEQEDKPKKEYVSWLERVDDYRNLFKSKSTGELVLAPLAATNSKTKTKYFISFDGQPLRPATKDELLPYLTPAKQANLINGRDDKTKFGPDGVEIKSAAQPLNFYLKKIYRIGNKGNSIF